MLLTRYQLFFISILFGSIFMLIQSCQHSQQSHSSTAQISKTSNYSSSLKHLLNNKNGDFEAQAIAAGLKLKNGKLLLDIQTHKLTQADQTSIEKTGAIVAGFFPKYQRISAYIDNKQCLQQLLQLPFIRYITEDVGFGSKQKK